jgi:hypothetical protein
VMATKAPSDSLLQWWCSEQQLRRQVAFQLAVRSLRSINITTATCRMWADRPHACRLGWCWCKAEAVASTRMCRRRRGPSASSMVFEKGRLHG